MFRRCRNSRRSLAVLALAAMLAPGLAYAGLKPLVMGPLYTEPTRPADAVPATVGGCPVTIIALKDTRREPETMGSELSFRAIQAPADRDAWLRSVFEVGLVARGFKPTFAASDTAAPPDQVVVRVRMTALWIWLTAMNKSGSVVIRVAAAPPGAAAGPEKIYRGDETAVNWMGSQGEFNGMLDKVFADALDDLATDLRPLCPAPPPPASASTAAAPSAPGS